MRGITDWLHGYLEGGVHEARVAQVTEAAQSRLRLGVPVVVGGAVGIGASQPVGEKMKRHLISPFGVKHCDKVINRAPVN